MTKSKTPCPKCGVVYGVGDWPFCRGGHGRTTYSVLGDEIPGGQVIENLGDEPMTFYSKKAVIQEADRRGLRMRDQWAGPHDKYLSNWGAVIDAQTLENVRVLLSRGSLVTPAVDPATEPAIQLHTGKIWTRTIKKWSEVE